jgi:hypothetical protein
VIAWTDATRDWLAEHDPQALKQLERAIGEVEGNDGTLETARELPSLSRSLLFQQFDEVDSPTPEGQSLYCPQCDALKVITKVHPANMRHFDPTESYTLECGHTVI